jgi:hypothetical protein
MPRPTLTHIRTAAAALLLTAVGTFGAPAAASATTAGAAATCPWTQGAPTSSLNPYSSTDYTVDTTPARVGPYEACYPASTYPAGTRLTVNCYVSNSYGNTWSYIRGTGWVFDEHLSNYGSPYPCRF